MNKILYLIGKLGGAIFVIISLTQAVFDVVKNEESLFDYAIILFAFVYLFFGTIEALRVLKENRNNKMNSNNNIRDKN